MELSEARCAVNDMTTINSKSSSDKRRLESAVHTIHRKSLMNYTIIDIKGLTLHYYKTKTSNTHEIIKI